MSTFAIVGYGSAALHLIHAAVKLDESLMLIPSSKNSFNKLEARYKKRYQVDLPKNIRVLDSDEKKIHFKVGLVATPPLIHSESVNTLLKFSKNTVPPKIFVEKPLFINPNLIPYSVVSDSHLNFSQNWNFFINQVILNYRIENISKIKSVFMEDLSGAILAHAWNPGFKYGWLIDENKGGGPLTEYSHALHWLGKFIQISGQPLPYLELIESKSRYDRFLKNKQKSGVTLFGNSQKTLYTVKQEILPNKSMTEKFVELESDLGEILKFDFKTLDIYEAQIESRVNLLKWLIQVTTDDREFLLMRERAKWVYETISLNS